LYTRITELTPDLIITSGFLVKVPDVIINHYKGKILNIHPSLIPSFCGVGYYGIKVHEEALARGVKITGATVHYVDTGMDTGPIFLQKAVEVMSDDTPQTLQKRVMEQAEWVILPQAINILAMTMQNQDPS
ncbi:MAG: phosphoribosylglycinamide formyltransferase, partial [Lachnospiraceae bacterium]|nr:phosphoribosylglycinamide formyltransferase [Lachnospiraceae bacterium]